MKKRDLQPTPENIQKTFLDDTIGRNTDLLYFIEIIESISDNYSIAIDSPWGSGKTFFVKQLKMILDTHSIYTGCIIENEDKIRDKWKQLSKDNGILTFSKNITIYYDAWENDTDYDPIISMIYQIVKDTNNYNKLKEKITFSDVLSVAGKIAEIFAGFDPNEIAESLKKPNILDKLNEEKSISETIKEFLDSILPENDNNRLIIIIDELDRCNPKFAVKLLERIKHYFYNDKITFIFSVNLSELQHTISHYYGQNFNSGKYLDRFFDLRISLPPANIKKYYESIEFYDSPNVIDTTIKHAISHYNLQLREISKYIELMKAITQKYNNAGSISYSYAQNFIMQVIIPVAVGLKLTNPSKYINFINGEDNTPLREFYNNKDILNSASYFLSLLYDNKHELNFNDDTIMYVEDFYRELDKFYDLFFNRNNEQTIGACKISDSDRQFFLSLISLLSEETISELKKYEDDCQGC